MSGACTQDIALAKALGYTVYHYDKGYREDCYYQLMDAGFNPVIYIPTYRAGERKTEAEAWDDAPRFASSNNLMREVEDAIERRGLRDKYLDILVRAYAPVLTQTAWEYWMPENYDALWSLVRATPEQRCQAALQALGVADV